MTEIVQVQSKWRHVLASFSGKALLSAFWVSFVVAGLGAMLPVPLSTLISGIAQLILALIWIGYPIALFYSFTGPKARVIGVSMMVCGVIIGYVLSVFVYDQNGNLVKSTVFPLLGAALVLAPFIASARALTDGERAAQTSQTASVATTAVALFALPFFGAYVHERFRRAVSMINTLSL